ncbi:MAG: radical SAM protein [Candidatus Diapherotrites archaeon]|nr:radical SAM protein [Candidatus Diapherotrites archaeon]
MAKIKENRFGSVNAGALDRGCLLCMQGKKVVIVATGMCPMRCYFCPIGEGLRGKDIVKANERVARRMRDIVTEAEEMRAQGAGITGGEPLLVVKRVCGIIRMLKKRFGKKFHVHLYTEGSLANEKNVKMLEKSGLDEIRFQLLKNKKGFGRILPALRTKMQVTVEVPAIPTRAKERELREMIDFMKKNGVKFLNLNEFEFSDSNFGEMLRLGFRQEHEFTYAVKGSREAALRLMRYARPEIKVHFCPTFIKSGLQLRERLRRRALAIRKPFERVNADGFIEKATVEVVPPAWAKKILKKFRGKKKFLFYNRKKNRIETTEPLAEKIAEEFGLRAFRLVEYPCFDPWDFEKEPLE